MIERHPTLSIRCDFFVYLSKSKPWQRTPASPPIWCGGGECGRGDDNGICDARSPVRLTKPRIHGHKSRGCGRKGYGLVRAQKETSRGEPTKSSCCIGLKIMQVSPLERYFLEVIGQACFLSSVPRGRPVDELNYSFSSTNSTNRRVSSRQTVKNKPSFLAFDPLDL